MHPELFALFGFTFKAYSFFTCLALVAVLIGTAWLAGRRGLSRPKTVITLSVMAIGAFIGARLLHIGLNYGLYKSDPTLALSLDFRGFSLYGGIILSAVVGLISCRILSLDPWRMADSGAPFLGFGIALMRVGCFLNGCCFGKVTGMAWGVRFPALSQAHIYQLSRGEAGLLAALPVHPVQIYEFLAALIASGVAIFLMRRRFAEGLAALSFGIIFTTWRWISYSFFRVRPETFDAPLFFYPLLYAGTIAISLIIMAKKIKKGPGVY
jgi:phosphatidylglycerol---prolipoprotein diacylglyceryl transferase